MMDKSNTREIVGEKEVFAYSVLGRSDDMLAENYLYPSPLSKCRRYIQNCRQKAVTVAHKYDLIGELV